MKFKSWNVSSPFCNSHIYYKFIYMIREWIFLHPQAEKKLHHLLRAKLPFPYKNLHYLLGCSLWLIFFERPMSLSISAHPFTDYYKQILLEPTQNSIILSSLIQNISIYLKGVCSPLYLLSLSIWAHLFTNYYTQILLEARQNSIIPSSLLQKISIYL